MLCQQKSPIKNSHLWPKFTVKWLKENSSRYIRRADIPNRRMEDVTKFPLLCTDCENLFSKFEGLFSARIFKPYQANHMIQHFDYGRWLSKFAISMSWRMLAIEYVDFSERCPGQKAAAELAFEHWRRYLLGESLKIQPYRHHMFFFSFVRPDSSGIDLISENYHSYTLRSLDGAIYSFDTLGVVYVLLPGIVFWSPLNPHDDSGWPKGSAIAERGKFHVGQRVSDGRLLQAANQGANLAYDKPLSEKQMALIAHDYNLVKAEKSSQDLERILAPLRHDQLLSRWKKNDK